MKYKIDNILGIKLENETMVNFSKDSETIIPIPMHYGLLATLEESFYRRILIVLDPIEEVKSIETFNVFSVNGISLSNGEASVKVVSYKKKENT